MIVIALRCLLIPVWWVVKLWYKLHERVGECIFWLMTMLKIAAFGWTRHFKKLNKKDEEEEEVSWR